MKGLDSIATVIRRIFRAQRPLAAADKSRFGDWDGKLAKELGAASLQVFLESVPKEARKTMADTFASMASQRAIQSAREINDTTENWLDEGRDLKAIFGVDRVVTIAGTEANFAIQAAKVVLAKARGRKVRWKLGPKPCKFCKGLKGKVRKPGEVFGIHHGIPIIAPPAHVRCMCSLEEVTATGVKPARKPVLSTTAEGELEIEF